MFINGHDEKSVKSFTPVKIGRGMIYSNVFQKCLLISNKILKYDFPPFIVYHKEKESQTLTARNKSELLDIFMQDGKKGMTIQRYKGLG